VREDKIIDRLHEHGLGFGYVMVQVELHVMGVHVGLDTTCNSAGRPALVDTVCCSPRIPIIAPHSHFVQGYEQATTWKHWLSIFQCGVESEVVVLSWLS
jgi:hypothetical protein